MIKDEKFNVDSANLVLSPNQMIFIPKNIGISDIVVKQKRVVYINDFHSDRVPEFMQGSDNITAIQ
jgi:hypothetical protein